MSSLEVVSKNRSFAKNNFTQNHNKLLPLVYLTGPDACENLQNVKDHVEEVTLEKDMEEVLNIQYQYLNGVDYTFMAARKQFDKFIQATTEEVEANAIASSQSKRKSLQSLPYPKLTVFGSH